MFDWVSVKNRLPEPKQDVLAWDGMREFVGYFEWGKDKENPDMEIPVWNGSWTDDFNGAEVSYWTPTPQPPDKPIMTDVKASISFIKQVIANQSPEQIGAEIGGQVTDYDLRIPFDRNHKGKQHPEFLMEDGPKESLDK